LHIRPASRTSQKIKRLGAIRTGDEEIRSNPNETTSALASPRSSVNPGSW
jgi:hypothetical protein